MHDWVLIHFSVSKQQQKRRKGDKERERDTKIQECRRKCKLQCFTTIFVHSSTEHITSDGIPFTEIQSTRTRDSNGRLYTNTHMRTSSIHTHYRFAPIRAERKTHIYTLTMERKREKKQQKVFPYNLPRQRTTPFTSLA